MAPEIVAICSQVTGAYLRAEVTQWHDQMDDIRALAGFCQFGRMVLQNSNIGEL